MIVQFMPHMRAWPEPRDVAWEDLARSFCSPEPTDLAKAALPAIVPCKLKSSENGRRAANVEHVTMLFLDLDDGTVDDRDRVLGRLRAANISHCYHSTYSYDPLRPDGYRYRVIVQLDQPVPAERWKPFRALAIETFGASASADPKTQDPCRLYYLPYYPADGPPPDAGRHDGVPLNTELLLSRCGGASSAAGEATPSAQRELEPEELRRCLPADKYLDRQSAFSRLAYTALRRMLHAERPYAEPGERDNTLFALARVLARKLRHVTAESITAALALEIDMAYPGDPDAPSSDVFGDKLRRAQADLTQELAGEDPIAMDAIGREGPYTPEEIQEFLEKLQLPSAEHLAQHLVLHHGKDLYVFFEGDYICAGSIEAAGKLLVDRLRCATTLPGVELRVLNAKGEAVAKTPRMLADEYGVSVERVVPSLVRQQSEFCVRPRPSTLYHAVCKRRVDYAPKYSQDVDRWLTGFVSAEDLPVLLDWLATAPRLERATSLLLLQGPKQTGKSRLLEGLASIWGSKNSKLEHNLPGSFNDTVTRNPIIGADESLPQEYQDDTGLLRSMITETDLVLNRKFMNTSHVEGSLRFIVTTNNFRELFTVTQEAMTGEAIHALQERILFFDTRGICPRIPNREVGEHILWLGQTREVEAGPRLWVEGRESAFHRQLRVSSRPRALVCQWVLGLIHNPTRVSTHSKLFRLDARGVVVSPRLVYDHFDAYCGKERQLSLTQISSVVREIGERVGRGLYQIRLEDLAQYSETHADELTTDEIRAMCVEAQQHLARVMN